MKKYDHRGNERHTDQDVVSFSLIYVFISDVYCRTGWIVDWDGTLVSITIWRGLLSPRTKSGSLTSLSMIRRRYFLTFITTLIYQLYVFLCCSAAIQQCSTIIKKFLKFPWRPLLFFEHKRKVLCILCVLSLTRDTFYHLLRIN